MSIPANTSVLAVPVCAETLKNRGVGMKSLDLRGAQLALIELLMAGYCSPLVGYLNRKDAAVVLVERRLADGAPFPQPALLGIDLRFAASIASGDSVALRDPEGVLLAVMQVEDIWTVQDLPEAAARRLADFGFHDTVYIGGKVQGVEMPVHYDFSALRFTPEELRNQYVKRGWRKVLACQPDGMIHRAEAARIVHAARVAQANVLVQALVTDEQTITLGHYTRIRCLERCVRYLPERAALLVVTPMLPVATGGVEVLWRTMLARNAGATHLLVEPEWWNGTDIDDHFSITLLAREAGVELVDLPRFVRDSSLGAYLPVVAEADNTVANGATAEVIRRVRAGQDVPEWLSFPDVVDELRRSHPVRSQQGVTVFFTGLSGAGKSTIARVLLAKLLEIGERTVTLLDGDVVRKNLSSELGFSRDHRDLNIQRIGFVASEITKHGGIAICAPIAPYRATRRRVRQMVEEHGGFIEVHVATPLDTCEARDRKGLYAKARAGLVKEFTGISDPYETPEHAELVIDTRDCTPLEAAQMIVTRLESDSFIR